MPSVRPARPYRYENIYTNNAMIVLDWDPDVLRFDPNYSFSWGPEGSEGSLRLFAVESKTRAPFLIDVHDSHDISSPRGDARDNPCRRSAVLTLASRLSAKVAFFARKPLGLALTHADANSLALNDIHLGSLASENTLCSA